MNLAAQLQPLRQRWAGLSERERGLVAVAAAALGVLLLWYGLLRPVWQTYQTVPAQRAEAQLQWLRMQAQATEAQELQGQAVVSAEQSRLALKAATERLGEHARLQLSGDRATLVLTNASVAQWRTWLGEVRQGARGRPLEADLRRNEQGQLSGQVVVQLPASAS